MSLYNADGQINLTVVNGSSYTGLYAADGSWNIVLNDGTTIKGYYHPCGAINAVVTTDPSSGSTSPNGSMYVISNSFGGYTPVTSPGQIPTPPSNFLFLTDTDGAYLIDTDSYYLTEAS